MIEPKSINMSMHIVMCMCIFGVNRMKKLNENSLAVEICKREGKVVNLPIGQVKEVVNIVFDILAENKMSEVIQTIEKHKK